ncbi:MAG: site-specific integrase [Desulfobacterales bacterium]
MGTKWKPTKFPGVRYREHPERKHGVQKDKYFAIRYQKEGKRKEEGLGWASEGWTVQKASITLSDLKRAHVTGEGPTRLSEKRDLAKTETAERLAVDKQNKIDSLTYSHFFDKTYFPQSKANKSQGSWTREIQFHKIWVSPVIGDKSLKDVSPLDLERIKSNMTKAKRAPRTIHYCLATIRQVFNTAKLLGLYSSDNPVSKVKKPKVDNRRLRFLNRDEAQRLLDDLRTRSLQLYNMALLSLHCGLRAGEIFSLTWSDVDIERKLLIIRDPKGGKSRYAFMTTGVAQMFASIEQGASSERVFKSRNGGKVKEISNAFSRAVTDLNFNEGVADRRHLVTFHTLRHTFASWLVEGGTDLYAVKELLGHSTLAMTERYSHLSNGTLQKAVDSLDKSLLGSESEKEND